MTPHGPSGTGPDQGKNLGSKGRFNQSYLKTDRDFRGRVGYGLRRDTPPGTKSLISGS